MVKHEFVVSLETQNTGESGPHQNWSNWLMIVSTDKNQLPLALTITKFQAIWFEKCQPLS